MTPPTPMHAYQSITTARVMPPAAPTRPAAYATRMAQHIALGKTPAQAMAAIERADGHMGRVPPKAQPGNSGIRKTPRPNSAALTADRIMPHLTTEWQHLSPALCGAIGVRHETIRMAIKALVAAGKVECKRGNGRTPSMWRLA